MSQNATQGRTEPDWWLAALELEQQDRLKEAEQAIHAAMYPNYPFAAQTAELYRLRAIRLLGLGRDDEAREATDKAIGWIDANASMATSGGEGAALSYAAAQFKKTLPKFPPPSPPRPDEGR